MSRPVSINLFAVTLLAALSGPAGAASFCDPNLLGKSDSPTAYREREGRCEGTYAQQVGTVSLDVRSFVESFGPFDLDRDTELVLAWTAPPGTERNVRLRAFSFKPRHYFRMDTAVPAARGSFRWPTDVLASQKLGEEELGVVAWTELPGPGGTTREIYLPLRVKARSAGAKDGYQVSLVPSARLREVHVTVSRLDTGGDNVVATLRQEEELGYGIYLSNQPTEFSIGNLGPAGFYRLEVTARPVSGPPVEQDLEFYHPGD
ncbi:MAG TPA: hypothetical protein VE685_14340 [Thermoanaerobaculia bacterium]|nr:hypothetical protein [Thermoanaerobaculia bacterium]